MFENSDKKYYDLERKKNNIIKKDIKNRLSESGINYVEYNNFCYYIDRVHNNLIGFDIEQVKLDAAVYYNYPETLNIIRNLDDEESLLNFLILLNGNYTVSDMIALSKSIMNKKIIEKLYSIKVDNFELFIEQLFYTIISRTRFFKQNVDVNRLIEKLNKMYKTQNSYTKIISL